MAGLCAGSISAWKEESRQYGSAQRVRSQWHQLQQPWCHSYFRIRGSQKAGTALQVWHSLL